MRYCDTLVQQHNPKAWPRSTIHGPDHPDLRADSDSSWPAPLHYNLQDTQYLYFKVVLLRRNIATFLQVLLSSSNSFRQTMTWWVFDWHAGRYVLTVPDVYCYGDINDWGYSFALDIFFCFRMSCYAAIVGVHWKFGLLCDNTTYSIVPNHITYGICPTACILSITASR